MKRSESVFTSVGKFHAHRDRLRDWQQGRNALPIAIEFDLTGRCNHHCPKCCAGYRCGDMPENDARKYISELSAYGTRGVVFSGGGDPLMHPACVSLVEHARSKGPKIVLMTNGCLMTAELAERFVAVCDGVRISIDAASPDVYRRIHGAGQGDFDAAWKAVAILANAKSKHLADCAVGVGFLVGEQSMRGMRAAAKMAKESGADYIQFRPFHYERLVIDEAIDRCREEENECFRILSSAHKYGRMGISNRGYSICHGAEFSAVIQADANVAFCCHLRGQSKWYLGNLQNQTFAEIWESKCRRERLGQLDASQCLPLCRHDANNAFLASPAAVQEVLESNALPPIHAEFL